MIALPAGTGAGEAQSVADQALVAYRSHGPRVEGSLPITAGLGFGTKHGVEWWEKGVLRESAELALKKKVHAVRSKRFETQVFLGDYAEPVDVVLTRLLGKLARET
jgi:hypothetical protein